MTMKINNDTFAVNTTLAKIMQPVLYSDPIFIDGQTFTSQFTEPSAGEILVDQFVSKDNGEVEVLGNDFDDQDLANSQVPIRMLNSAQKGYKIPQYASNAVPQDLQNNTMYNLTQEIRVKREKGAMASLIDGGTVSTNTTVITKSNIKDTILDIQADLAKKFVSADTVFLSVEAHKYFLQSVGAEYTPLFNDDVVRRGKVGQWMGMLIVQAQLLDNSSTYKYINDANVKTSVSVADIDMIVFNHNAFSIVDFGKCFRIIPTERFVGSLAQGQIVSGFKVTNKDAVVVKKHTVTP